MLVNNRYHFHRHTNMFNYSGASNNIKNGTLRLNGVLSGTTTTGFQSDMSILHYALLEMSRLRVFQVIEI